MAEPIYHIKNMKICQKAPTNPAAIPLRLDNVAAYNLDIDVGDKKVSTIITLHQVPSFIVEAFTRLQSNDAWNIEGIFRKEGNVNRIRNVMPVYFGCAQIPPECTTHDICTLIKRFFREIKTPVFGDKQRNILKFAETLKDKTLVDSIMLLIHNLPPCHIGTIGYLMRLLKEVSDNWECHQMTVDNLATVFAPSLFRDETPPLQSSSTKKKLGSQDNLLSIMRTMNDRQTTVIKLLIQNSHLIGMPKLYYKATRKPSDLKKHEMKLLNSSVASKEFGVVARNKISPRSTSENPVKRIPSYSSSSSSALVDMHQTEQNEEKNKLNKRYSMKDGSAKKDRRRSNSVVRLFSEVRNVLAGRRSSGAGLVQSDNPPRFLDTIPATPQRISMDPEPSPHASPAQMTQLAQVERQSRNESPKCVNPNAAKFPLRTPSGRKVREVMRERTPIVRPPLPNWNEFSRDDDKKENSSIVRRTSSKRSSDANQSILSSSSHNKRPPTDISAISPLPSNGKTTSSPTVKDSRHVVDRARRHTAPVKRSLQRNKPNSVNSGLVEPKNRRSNTIVLNGTGEMAVRRPRIIKRPSKRRSNECLGSSHTETDTDDEIYENKNMSLFGVSPAGDNAGDILEKKGMVARQRRVRRQKTKQSLKISFDDSSPMSLESPSSTMKEQNTLLIESGAQTSTEKFIKAQLTPMSSISPKLPEKKSRNDNEPPDVSMPSDAYSSDDYLGMKSLISAHETPPPLPSIPPPSVTPQAGQQSSSPTKSKRSSKLEREQNEVVHLSQQTREKNSCNRNVVSPRKNFESQAEAGTSTKVEILPSGTTVFVADESRPHTSSAVQHTPKRYTSPNYVKFRKPVAKLNLNDDNPSPGFSNSKTFAQKITEAQSSSDLPMHDFQPYPSANLSNRPSLAFFQRNNRGFVRQRVSQFANFDKMLESIPSNRSSSNDINEQYEFVKPVAPPAAHNLIPGELRRSAGDTVVAKRAIVLEHKDDRRSSYDHILNGSLARPLNVQLLNNGSTTHKIYS
uniref:Rho-GAP domain-containing protein n=1 Tax=Acrobeloides nanus TaxID=290746 RepID=A0A914DGN0_9BILA